MDNDAVIGLINYGSGNFKSVWNALCHLGIENIEIKDGSEIKNTTHLLLPGVGSFPDTMAKLKELNLIDLIREQVLVEKKPYLGICVGMQILATTGEEFQTCEGLDLIQGTVRKIDVQSNSLSLPHIGWNEIDTRKPSPLFEGVGKENSFYFVHSFHFQAHHEEQVLATCNYGGNVCAAVQKDHIFGVQFHPEKSQRDGLQLLENFSKIPSPVLC